MSRPADARLIASPGLDGRALERLRASTVVVIGAGMLGGLVIFHLALLGVTLIVVDADTVDDVNLANQHFPTWAVGQPKSVARARQVHELNPACPVEPLVTRIEDLGLAALAHADLLVTGLDGRAARAHVNTVARLLGRPWVDMAVDGSGQRLFGTVALYDSRRDEAACYLCRLDTQALGAIARQGRGGGCYDWRRPGAVATPPTLQTSSFGAVVAGYSALWSVRALLGSVDELVSRQLVVEADTVPRTRLVTLARNPRCDHPRGQLVRSPAATLGELLAAAAGDLGAAAVEVTFPGRVLVTRLTCPGCLAERDLVRVTEAVTDDELRCRCDTVMVPAVLTERLAGADLARACPGTWDSLGVPAADVVRVRAGAQTIDYIVGGAP